MKELRKQISKILISWSMPSRRPAINEIIQLFEDERNKLIDEIESFKMREEFPQMYDNGYDAAITDVVYFLKEIQNRP